MAAPKAFKNGQRINYAQVDNHSSKLQALEQHRQLTIGQNHGRGLHEENDVEDNEVDTGTRKIADRRYSQNAQGLNILNLNRQIQQPLLLHPRAEHAGIGENLDQQVDNIDQDHPELQRPLDTGRLHDKFLEEEVENQMDDDVDGRLLNIQHFVDQNDNKDQDSLDVVYDADVHGAFEETAPRGRAMNNGNNYRFQQNHRNQQQAVAYNKAALAQPMRAGVVQSPYNYPGIHPNYPNQNMVNNNGQYFIQQQQQLHQQQQHAQQYYRRGLKSM
jgi:hypothetical protein